MKKTMGLLMALALLSAGCAVLDKGSKKEITPKEGRVWTADLGGGISMAFCTKLTEMERAGAMVVARPGCYVAAAGTTMPRSAGRRFATAASRRTRATALVPAP